MTHTSMGDPDTEIRAGPVSPESWPVELTRRLRVLLHTLPFEALRRGDALRDPELRHYDGIALALRALDIIIDRLGLEKEADREVIARLLEPTLAAMDAASNVPVSAARHERMIDVVLDGLRNDRNARRPFREEYTIVEGDGHASRHALEFRLLCDTFHPAGRTVLRPSSEACNLYLRLLDLDIEDAQTAAEAVVESQLARGRFDEAVHSARQARTQSVRFRDKVQRVLQDTRRDVERVDWREDAPRMLNEALAHLERRIGVERSILLAAAERLDALPDQEANSRRAVVQVEDLTHDCLLRHTELHEQLIGARSVFLDAQARQSFAPGPSQPLPDLLDDVLEPLLHMTLTNAHEVVSRGFACMMPPRIPTLCSIARLASWMLQPRRPQPSLEVSVDPIDPSEIDAELRRYPPAIRTAAHEILRELATDTRLSEVLAHARATGAPDAVLEVIALLTLRGFATEDRDSARIAAERFEGGQLDDVLLYGDDLLISSAGSDG
jgi:hypothetical protein